MRKMFASIPSSSITTALSLIAALAVGMIAYHFAFSDANADGHDSSRRSPHRRSTRQP